MLMISSCKFIVSFLASLCLLSSCDAGFPGIHFEKEIYEFDYHETEFVASTDYGISSFHCNGIVLEKVTGPCGEQIQQNDWCKVSYPLPGSPGLIIHLEENATSEDRSFGIYVGNAVHWDTCTVIQHGKQ